MTTAAYDTERAAFSRTPQTILEVAVPQCMNHYASGAVINDMTRTEEFNHAIWVKSGGTTVNADDAASPMGTTTADKINFAAVGDYIQQSSTFVAASLNYTGSIWLKTTSGTGTITLVLTNSAATIEETKLQVNLTTSWQRLAVFRAFGAGAGGVRIFKILRDTGDLAAVHAWGANGTLNTNLLTAVEIYAYKKLVDAPYANPSTCEAIAQADGKRCYYSFPTCQDKAHYNVGGDAPGDGLKVYKFCLADAPLPVRDINLLPLLAGFDTRGQKIDPEHSVTITERAVFKMHDDQGPGIWNPDRQSEGAKVNTQTGAGNFWRRWLAIHKNYANPRGYVRRLGGFVASGFLETDFDQKFRGLLRNIEIDSEGGVSLIATDRLKLLKAKIPAKISTTNLLNGAINSAVTSLTVDDATELTLLGSGYSVQILIDSEKMNVTAVSGNILTVQRGRWGTSAASHSNDAAWSEIAEYGTERTTPNQTPLGKNPIDIVLEILYRAGFAAADVDSATFISQRDTWLQSTVDATAGTQSGTTFRRSVADQTDAESLLQEIRDHLMLSIWVGEDQRISGKLIAPPEPSVTLTTITEDQNIVDGSTELDDNDESRQTRVVIAFTLSGSGGDKIEDYNERVIIRGLEEEGAGSFGDVRQKVILSKWLRQADTATAARLGLKIFNRFHQGVRNLSLSVEQRDDGIAVGDFVMVTSSRLQKADGSEDADRIMQMVSKEKKGASGIGIELVDTGLFRRYGFISPTGTPDYGSATPQQRRYGFAGTSTANLVNTGVEDGYLIW